MRRKVVPDKRNLDKARLVITKALGFIIFIVIIIIIHRFYITFSSGLAALEQTHCAHITRDSKRVTVSFS